MNSHTHTASPAARRRVFRILSRCRSPSTRNRRSSSLASPSERDAPASGVQQLMTGSDFMRPTLSNFISICERGCDVVKIETFDLWRSPVNTFHLSLDVPDLDGAVAFYTEL